MLPPIEGIAVSINGASLQEAIEQASAHYQQKNDQPATHVALPKDADLDGVIVGALNLARHSGPGVVIVGRVYVRR